MIDLSYKDEYPNVVGLSIRGTLTSEDYHTVIPVLDRIIEHHGSLRAVVNVNNFQGMTLHAIFDELKFDTTHWTKFHRVAIVGEKTWHEQMTKLSDKLMHGQMQFFHTDQLDQAWQWASE